MDSHDQDNTKVLRVLKKTRFQDNSLRKGTNSGMKRKERLMYSKKKTIDAIRVQVMARGIDTRRVELTSKAKSSNEIRKKIPPLMDGT